MLSTGHRRERRRAQGLPSWRLVRYADDFVVLVNGTGQDNEALREEIAEVAAPMGLRLRAGRADPAFPGFGGGWVGYLGFGYGGEVLPAPRRRAGPAAARVVVWLLRPCAAPRPGNRAVVVSGAADCRPGTGPGAPVRGAVRPAAHQLAAGLRRIRVTGFPHRW